MIQENDGHKAAATQPPVMFLVAEYYGFNP